MLWPCFGPASLALYEQATKSYSSWALHEPLECMMKKVLFSWFSIVFGRFWPCASMHLVVEIHNISLLIFKCNLRFWKASKSGQKVRISDAENVWSCSPPTNWILNDHSFGFQLHQDFSYIRISGFGIPTCESFRRLLW